MSPHEAIEIEAWVERADWVRTLARALVADPHDADDLAQEAWLASLGGGPSKSEAWRAWIAGVVRNLARRRWRGDARRERREREAARGEIAPEGDELLERLEVHERLVAAVRELDEPYRSAILLRYFEGLAPAEIAARTRAPLRTVHTRLSRGLAKLRASLDRRHGARGAWMALLLPLVKPPAAPLAGALVMDIKLKVAVVSAALAGTIVCAWLAVRPATPARAAVEARTDAPGEIARAEQADPQRIETAAAEPVATSLPNQVEPSPTTPAPASAASLRGIVLDLEGDPRANVEVDFLPDDASSGAHASTRSGEDGRFVLAEPGRAGTLEVRSDALVTVFRSRVSERSQEAEHAVVVAPRISLGGRVVDPGGTRLAAAKVHVEPRADVRSALHRVLDAALLASWVATSDELGQFALPDAPAMAEAKLVVELQGFETASIELPQTSELGLEIVLRPHAERARHLIGRVVDASRQPVEGALVALMSPTERMSVLTNAHGEFDLVLERSARDAPNVCAIKKGYLPGEVQRSGEAGDVREAWPDPLVIELGSEPLSLEGRVLDAEGRPVPGAELIPLDNQRFGMVEQDFSGSRFWIECDVEQMLGSGGFGRLRADEHGRFEIGGLLPRSYRFQVFDRRTLCSTVTPPLAAGRRGVEIRLEHEESRARIAGVVVDRAGQPVEGAQVWCARPGEKRGELGTRAPATVTSTPILTDREGRFELRAVARAADTLCVQAPDLPAILQRPLAPEPDLEALRIVVDRRCHAQVDLTQSTLNASGVAFLDEHGEKLTLTARHGDVSFAAERFGLTEKRTEVLSVPGNATAVLLLDADDAEIARIPIQLRPGELNLIRP